MSNIDFDIIIQQMKDDTIQEIISWDIIEECNSIKEFTNSIDSYISDDSSKFISRT